MLQGSILFLGGALVWWPLAPDFMGKFLDPSWFGLVCGYVPACICYAIASHVQIQAIKAGQA